HDVTFARLASLYITGVSVHIGCWRAAGSVQEHAIRPDTARRWACRYSIRHMTTATAERRPRAASLTTLLRGLGGRLLLAAIVCMPILLFAPFFTEPFEGDEGAYGTIAQQMLHGYLPYRDIFDHKPPLVYVWYAVSFLIFGQNIIAPRILAALSWSATTMLVYVQGKLLLGRRQALIAAAVFGFAASLTMLSFNANTEVFLILPLMGATVAFTKAHQSGDTRWLLVAGLCGG